MARGPWRGVLGASAGCLVSGMIFLVVCPAAAQAAPVRCAVRGHSVPGVRTSKVVKSTGTLVVYRTRLKSEEYEENRDVWECDRKTNRFLLIGEEQDNLEYGTEGALSGFQLAGSWLIVTLRNGTIEESECEKYHPDEPASECQSTTESLIVVNGARGLMGIISGKSLPAGSALLSADGAIAWWSQAPAQGTEEQGVSSLYGCLSATTKRTVVCKPKLVAQGQIPESSVHLVANTLSWTAAGQPQSSTL